MKDNALPLESPLGPVWNQVGDLFYAAPKPIPTLPAGYYTFHKSQAGIALKVATLVTDNLIELPDTPVSDVISEFNIFWGLRERFQRVGMLHKRGILLYGPAGTGKTVSLLLMTKHLIENHDGIVCQIQNPNIAHEALQVVRKVEPDRPIVAIIEDLDDLTEECGDSGFLALLDGENQVDNIVYIATANQPETLDRRFTDRPSRFDVVKEVGYPSAPARRCYLVAKDSTIRDVEGWVRVTNGFSIAHLREMIILCQCFDIEPQDAAKRIQAMRDQKFEPSNASD